MKFIVRTLRRTPIVVVLVLLGLEPFSCTPKISRPRNQRRFISTPISPGKRVENTLGRITPEEKISQVHADSKFASAPVPRLGIPRRWTDDGPHGVREEAGFNSWNPAGRTDECDLAAGVECPGLHLECGSGRSLRRRPGAGIPGRNKDIILAPIVDIARTALRPD